LPKRRITRQQLGTYIMWQHAKKMRQNPTPTEQLMWDHIRNKIHPYLPEGVFFRRQTQVDRFILDFYCDPAKLAIEVDGTAHKGSEWKDKCRDNRLQKYFGVRTVRVKASTVYSHEIDHLCEAVVKIINVKV
jgi:very-short-patch-repair endonuclease